MEVGISELRDNLSRYLSAVREGSEITVTDHGKAIARITSIEHARPLDRLIAEGLVTPAKRPKRKLTGPGIKTAGTVSDLIAEQRG